MYHTGHGVPVNYAEAMRWYRLAAEQREPRAQYNIAIMYGNAQAVALDYEQAAHWFRLSAQQGNPRARFNLGLLHLNGDGVGRDLVQAHMWLDLAVAGGIAVGRKARDQLEKHLTPEQLGESRRMARELTGKDRRGR